MHFIKKIIILFILNCGAAQEHKVFSIRGPTRIESSPSSNNPLNIYCYVGSQATFLQLWKSVKLEISILSDSFQVYRGSAPDDVRKAYKDDTWIQSIFSTKTSRKFSLDPFNSSCLGIKATEKYDIEVVVKDVDYFFVGLLCVGVFLYTYARLLAENTLFYYLCGVTIGISASFVFLIYFLSKFLPGKPIVYSALASCTVGVYIFQLLWSNIKPLLYVYYDYVLWYVVITGFISFVVCYKFGPPKDKKSKNIISWILQASGVVLIYYSTYIFEVFCAITAVLLIIRIFPQFIIDGIRNFWRRRYPPKRKLLSKEEYYIQGQAETAKALEELRGYCSSPECKQWKLALSLKDPKRFASFMETSKHLSGDEMDDYEMSEFVVKKRNLTKVKVNNIQENDMISSDDSSLTSSDED